MGREKHRDSHKHSKGHKGHKDEDERKRLQKLTETPEERRARRLAKKEKKHGEKGKKEKELLGYTNDANPFGDPNLLTPFQWGKKNEVLAEKLGVSPEEIAKREAKYRRRELKAEVEKAKKRREEKEAERQMWEMERSRMAREAEGMNIDMEQREETFHAEQSRMRSEIRLREGRAKPIDLLAKNLEFGDEDIETAEPYSVFRGLMLSELEELEDDIQQRLDFGANKEYWQMLAIVCEDEISKAKHRDTSTGPVRIGTTGVLQVIESDLIADLAKKSFNALCEMEESITQKLRDGGVDAEYWEGVLRCVKVQQAKARLEQIHSDVLLKKLGSMQKMEAISDKEASEEESEGEMVAMSEGEGESESRKPKSRRSQVADAGSMSPPRIAELGPEEIAWDAEEDMADLLKAREIVIANRRQEEEMREEEKQARSMVSAEAQKGMGEGDVAFNIEVPIDHSSEQAIWWHEKYKPRKPRYFNRVHTGFEWNKYNQTHYDHDNPPPKTVQGYKFNIFYPDLIDPTQTPQYFIEKGDNPDTCTIRFHAGPPYEDIAFKIVNKEWAVDKRIGFKSTFERGILHLYFNFKRHRYRK